MKLTLKGDPEKRGHADEWSARCEGVDRPGIGKSRTEAMGSLLAANLRPFGVTAQDDIDPDATPPVVTWAAYNR